MIEVKSCFQSKGELRPPSKKRRKKSGPYQLKIDELPELPFEQILIQLSLEDRLRARAVSKGWRRKFDSYPVKSLCYSERPDCHILGNRRRVSGAFAKNFIRSRRFSSFFNTIGQTILSNLNHLRLCDIRVYESESAAFSRSLTSFGQLEQLEIIRVRYIAHLPSDPLVDVELNTPMLHSIHLEKVKVIAKLTLKTERLKRIKIADCPALSMEFSHVEPIERLLVDRLEYTEVKNLKNLKYLYIYRCSSMDPTFLSSLEQLKEIHLVNHRVNLNQRRLTISELFSQKERCGRVDLKIYLLGLLLSGPDDPAISYLDGLHEEALRCLAENSSRLADEIPFHDFLRYSAIQLIVPGLEMNVLKRFTDLEKIVVYRVQNIERFLDIVKNLDQIVRLEFYGVSSQELFDRLPEHSALRRLAIIPEYPWMKQLIDFQFLSRLKNLTELYLPFQIDIEIIRTILEELPFLWYFEFVHGYNQSIITIQTVHPKGYWVFGSARYATVDDVNAVIQFITHNWALKKPKL